jgi:bifunctional ADP-heptose synthase (sugar kinase/adenylyltransferase)
VVTLTQDKHVNKGPGRPVFNEHIRAETIAALQAVDYVALNRWPTAIETIHLLKPTYYVKGPDYKIHTNDLTGNIGLEEKAVQDVGGQMRITDDITFSSSSLINAHFNPLDETTQSYILQLKKDFSAEHILNEIEKLKGLKVLVIGDTIIDEYHTTSPLGKSSKSPTISTKYMSGVSYAGGTLAIANHLGQYAGKVHMVTLLGEHHTQQDFIESKMSDVVEPYFFYRTDGPTPTKRRYIDKFMNIKLFEVTFMNDTFIDAQLESEIIDYLRSQLDKYDLVMVADFGHGFISPGIVQFLSQSGKYLCVNAQTNSNNFGFNYITKYHRVDYISIDEKELRLPFGDNYGAIENLVFKLKDITHCDNIQITLGQKGALVYNHGHFYQAPALAGSVKDSVGAGDAVLSVTSLLSFNGAEPEIIPFVGNCVGALAVQIIGNEHPVYKKDLNKFITHILK